MKFMLLVYGGPDVLLSESEFTAQIAADTAFQRRIRESGELVSAHGLADAVNARVVRVRDGVREVSEGPYLAAEEHLAAYFVVDCGGLDRAIELAARYSAARGNGVEVWPLLEPNGTEM